MSREGWGREIDKGELEIVACMWKEAGNYVILR